MEKTGPEGEGDGYDTSRALANGAFFFIIFFFSILINYNFLDYVQLCIWSNNTEQQGQQRTATTDNQRHQPPSFSITQPSNHLDDTA